MADIGAHAHNLLLSALKLGPLVRIESFCGEPVRDSYASSTRFRWDFAEREGFTPVSVWWHDGADAAPPPDVSQDLIATFGKVPTNGVLFVGSKSMLRSNAWGGGGVMRLKSDSNPKRRGVMEHEAAKPVPIVYPRVGGEYMKEFLDACRGGQKTFQDFNGFVA